MVRPPVATSVDASNSFGTNTDLNVVGFRLGTNTKVRSILN